VQIPTTDRKNRYNLKQIQSKTDKGITVFTKHIRFPTAYWKKENAKILIVAIEELDEKSTCTGYRSLSMNCSTQILKTVEGAQTLGMESLQDSRRPFVILNDIGLPADSGSNLGAPVAEYDNLSDR